MNDCRNVRRGPQCWALAAALAAAAPAGAAEADRPKLLEEVVVTASRAPQARTALSRAVSVVTTDDLLRRQSPDLVQGLAGLPGISASGNGGYGGQLVVRGFSTNGFRAPLFVDGDRFRGRNTLEYLLFPPELVERVEIVRGPAASLYGTDSFGGVINVITRRPAGIDRDSFQLDSNRVVLGTDTANDGRHARAQFGGAGGGFDVLAGYSHREGDDFESARGTIPNSDYRVRIWDGVLGYSFAPGQRIELSAKRASVERGRAGGVAAAPGAANPPGTLNRIQREDPMDERFVRLAYVGEGFGEGAWLDRVEATLYRRHLDTDILLIPDTRTPANFSTSRVPGPTVWGGRVLGFSGFGDVSLTFGVDAYDEDRPASLQSVRGGLFLPQNPDSEQLNVGAFVLAEWRADPSLTLSGSLRYDYLRTDLDVAAITNARTRALFAAAGETENHPLVGSLGAVWQATPTVAVFGNVATAFRAPSVTELVAVGTIAGATFRVPNPAVEPETGRTAELGLRLTGERLRAELVAFHSDYRDLIDREVPIVFEGAPAVQLRNIGRARMQGVEFETVLALTEALRVDATATWLRGTDTRTDRPLDQVPPLNGRLALRYAAPGSAWSTSAMLDWARRHERIDPRLERESAGYAVASLHGSLDLGRWLPGDWARVRADATVENLFDRAYALAATPESLLFPNSPSNPLLQPGRSLRLTLTAEF
ncbi:MAG: TonB-dependent receptor [Steroidobacteraceae bacterium]|jgi:hemoglobin/transferrin/lactoferrin receptor protein|nr:TonB-dependent receptor [Steroidobacteraceae bacterium]